MLTPVKLPAITINGDFNPWDIPPQTITEPPPKLSLSRTQASAKRSPLYRRRPCGRKRVNRDSSVKKTCLHCLIGNCLGPCAANQAIPRARRAWVRGKPMYGRRARRRNSCNWLLTVFGWMWRLWLPTVVKAVSVEVTWRLCRWARWIALSWRGVVTRGRLRRGRSATLPVSLRWRIRRYMLETFTPNCKATCCCLWPCISNAVAWPLCTSGSRGMITGDSN